MRRLVFVIFMVFVLAAFFYGPTIQYMLFGPPEAQTPVEQTTEEPEAEKPSLVRQYSAEKQFNQQFRYMTPDMVLGQYSDMLISGDARPILRLLSLSSQKLVGDGLPSTAQMRKEALAIERCLPGQVKSVERYAVVRFNLSARQCPPYFLIRELERWRIDLVTMNAAIRFNQDNAWHFDPAYALYEGEYGFAFLDWSVDINGYPITE